jgi:hypothetical protein
VVSVSLRTYFNFENFSGVIYKLYSKAVALRQVSDFAFPTHTCQEPAGQTPADPLHIYIHGSLRIRPVPAMSQFGWFSWLVEGGPFVYYFTTLFWRTLT